MYNIKATAMLGCLLSLLFFQTHAQDYAKPSAKISAVESPLVSIKLKDGTIIKGRVVSSNADYYTIKAENLGVMQLPAINILSIEQILDASDSKSNGIIAGFTPLISTDYSLGENAFNLKKGEVRYTNTMLVLNKFDVGITKNISISGTFVTTGVVALIGAKFTTDLSPMLHVGVSGYAGANLGASSGGGTLAQVFATYGKPTSNITVGGIWVSDNSPSLFQLSALHRISNKVALTTDNFFYGTDTYTYTYNGSYSQSYKNKTIDGLTTYGLKILWKRTTLDVGMFRTFSMGTTALPLGVPYIKLVTQIGRPKAE